MTDTTILCPDCHHEIILTGWSTSPSINMVCDKCLTRFRYEYGRVVREGCEG